MSKIIKKILSVTLVVCLLCSMIVVNVSAENSNSGEEQNMQTNIDDMSIKGTDSFGSLLTSEFEQEADKQEQNNGINIFSVDVVGSIATVELETLQDSMLIVAIYDESGVQMIASGNTEVTKEDTTAEVIIDIETMPEYFYLKAFLVDNDVYRPLCSAYESPNYTKEMQEFFAKTTDDFESDKVLNLDDDKTNNFAVYSDETKIIEKTESNNQVTSVDEESKKYVIENADSSITSLKEGDIFAYNYTDDETLIVKVKYISVNDTTVTVYGDDAEMEEVFEYVKIDSTVDTSNAYYDPSACDEGVTYEGSEGEVYMAESSISTFSEIEGSAEYTHSFSVSKTSGGASIQGGLDFLARASAKVYFTQIYQYVEFKIDYSASFGGTLSGSAGMKFAFGYFGISPVAGVYIDFTPSFVFRADAELSVTLTLTGTLGMSSSNKNGIQNISTLPKLMPEVKAEGIFFIGISLEPQIKVLGSAIVAEMGGEFGGEITAVLNDNEDNTEDVKHECKMCIAGEVNAVSSLNFGVKFLNNDDWKFGLKVSVLDIKVTDFYYSFDYDEFDFTTCPHYTYRVTVTALDEKGNPLSGIFVNDRYITDTSGKTEIYFPAGTYLITAKGIGLNGSNRITVDDKPASVKVVLREEESNDEDSDDSDFNSNTILSLGTSHSGYVTEDGDLYMWGWNKQGQLGDGTTTNRYTPTKIMSNVRAVSLGDRHSAAITETGDLYIWGYNDEGQLGNGTNGDYYIVTPTKIMSNVKAVSLSDSHSAAITETGDLYMWGRNNYGQLGDGTTTDRYVPTKIMNNVKAVSLGGSHSAAITETGDLYTWGVNSFGQLGVGISGFDNGDSCRVTPTKIMSNIKAVSLEGSNSAAITEDGDLYMWGWNRQGQIGDGTTTDRYSPTKIMNNVKAVSLGISHSAAIIEPGDLYTWGWNALGQLGNGTAGYDTYEDYSDDYIVTPKKVMSAVKTVSLGVNFSGAITEPGDLYMWGDNEWGQIGDGTAGMDSVNIYDMYIATPTKIISDKSSVQSIEAHDEAIVYTNLTASDFENNTVQTESFSGLLPNEVYNFYSMKTRDTVNPFDNSNLLYITQVTTDENGNLSISYIPDEEYENAVNFVVPFKQIDLSNAEVKMDDLVYSGETQYVSPVVTLNGRILTEGVDYDLHGDYSAKDIGDYNVTIVGRGLYNGEINISYSVSSADAAVGDVNNDGKIDIADATDIQRYISNLLDFNDEQKNAADIDKNGVINIIDVTQIQRYLANFIPSLG